MIAVIDYGSGNIHSVRNALELLGAEVAVTYSPDEIRKAERIVLPGVGAFGHCMKNLEASGVVKTLEEEVLRNGKPFYGICVGMQVLASLGLEMGEHAGLGWIPGTVKRLEVGSLKIPHVGWNEVFPSRPSPLFAGLRKDATFYFVHSFHLVAEDINTVAASCEYGTPFTAAIVKDNIFASQFHPEKSQQSGLKVLENFLRWSP